MAIIFIDYTTLSPAPAPAADAQPGVSGKFVRIRQGETEYLVFAPGDILKYHANIVERFCRDRGITGCYDREKKKYEVLDRSWTIRGGGKLEKNREGKTVRLYGDSMAYGKYESEGLREAVGALPEFSGFTVQVE